MNKELITNLIDEKNIELIYATTRVSKDKDNKEKVLINYTIVCDVLNIVNNIDLCKKIIATMEVIKELLSKYNIIFSYTIKTSNQFEEEMTNTTSEDNENEKSSIIEVVHCKDEYFKALIDEKKAKKSNRRA